ncbi:MAG: hypothetical protein ACOCY8_02270 [Spirochaetota bacterium]
MNPVDRSRARTLFQTHGYAADVDLRTDAVIVYGWRERLAEEVRTWRERGYVVHFMTGAAWGGYREYVNGDFDGRLHVDEAQVAATGERIDHGNEIFYFVPTVDYTEYLKAIVERAIDAGVDAVHLEEPEFWVRGGYSEAFRRLWEEHYGTAWEAPHASAQSWYAAARLKYLAYTELLQRVFDHAKEYAARTRPDAGVECYVASHSLLNYAQWGIVSPESNLAHLDSCDGYVCQVWTGTARTPNHYGGVRAERTFETAYLEYAQMMSMVLSTGRRTWFLADPIEDDPEHDWNDYRTNYHATLVASLLNHRVSTFEVMPWPQRVFRSLHAGGGEANEPTRIPPGYATELLTVTNALSAIGDFEITDGGGIGRVAVAVADTMLFERGWGESPRARLRGDDDRRPPDLIYRIGPGSDPEMDGFYGLALPLLKRGLFLRLAHLEHARVSGYLDELDLIVLSYDFMKPPSESAHEAIADWVRGGGILVYVGSPEPGDFDRVDAWWRQAPEPFDKPIEHLLRMLGVGRADEAGSFEAGEGRVVVVPIAGAALAHSHGAEADYVATVAEAYARGRSRDGAWRESDTLSVRRGPYRVVARMPAQGAEAGSPEPSGAYIDLFSPGLPVREAITPEPGSQHLLYDLEFAREGEVIAVAGRLERGSGTADDPYVVTAPAGIAGQLVLRSSRAPRAVRAEPTGDSSGADRNALARWSHDATHRIVRIDYDGAPDGVRLTIDFE